ncbi:MAG: restriction endonuclease [Gammaproteobacteria bacterium]|nr:restriction endonuclease [Gammaproteobacteria bacterium]
MTTSPSPSRTPPLGFWRRLRALLSRLWETRLPRGHRIRIRAARHVLRTTRALLSTPQGAPRTFGVLRRIDPLVFEELVLEAFRVAGFAIRRNRRYTGDGGIDGRVKIGRWRLIQCKRYAQSITPEHVAAFAQCVRRHSGRRGRGLFIHTGRTGPASRAILMEGAGRVVLVSGDRLLALLRGDRLEVLRWVASPGQVAATRPQDRPNAGRAPPSGRPAKIARTPAGDQL